MYLFLHGVLLSISAFTHLLYHLHFEVLRELDHLQHLLFSVLLLILPPLLAAFDIGLSQFLFHLELIELILILSLHEVVLLCVLKHLFS